MEHQALLKDKSAAFSFSQNQTGGSEEVNFFKRASGRGSAV